MTDYNIYIMTKDEKIKYFVGAYLFIFAVSYLFYANVVISAGVSCLAYYYLDIKKREIIKIRKCELLREFKDAIYLLSTAFSAGHSVENAFKKTFEGLNDLYQGREADILKEFEHIVKQASFNKSINILLHSLAERADIEDITNFVDVFIACDSTGGNLNEVIRNTSSVINEKMEIEEEIEVLVTNKKLEQKVISIIPICIMLILSLTASDYIDPLHNSLGGYIVTSIVLGLIFAASTVAKKIMEIEV
ncbi:MAG: hypothetical protein A2Y24_03570 [Clostridiales bacterium GWE2_32_10]|nr:MAG: hypothetical protein A2Y24_03570 [Clostridiales bacterium GWE2_32_10]HBY19571.1 pilus assembly protein TadB [Clostridiales bacterium]